MDDSIHSKSKPLCSTNNWTNDINIKVNDPSPTILATNTINIKHFDLRSNFVIQSCSNGSNQKSQFLKDGNFTKSSYSMMMEEFEYHSLFK